MNLQDISVGRHAPSIVNVVIEAPKGSRKKYRYHAKSRRFRLAYECSIPAPAEYGWIPETIAEDGHFLNAMVISHSSSHPGYICEARPIGILKRKDRDHHVICVLLGDENYVSVKEISDLDMKLVKEIVQFFEPYFELSGWLNHTETVEVIKTAHEKYIDKNKAQVAETEIEKIPETHTISGNSDDIVNAAEEAEENFDGENVKQEEKDADTNN